MDNNLDDSLNLESAIGVDFGHSEDAIVTQNDITLEYSGHEESIPMEFEHNEEQTILMDTGGEEMIDFMGDQFSLQEYSVQSDQTTALTTTVESNQQQLLSGQDTMIDLQFQPHIMSTTKQEPIQPKIIAVKNMLPMRTNRKNETALQLTAPRQVAIAPKPPKLVAKSYTSKQPAIAPKPVTFVTNKGLAQKVPIPAGSQSNSKGNTGLGKQFIMVPSSGSSKIKLIPAPGSMTDVQYIRADTDHAQVIPTKSVSGSQTKPVMTKYITVQGQSQATGAQQPTVITKLVGKGGRLVTMQQKAIPISLTNKILVPTSSKQGFKLPKNEIIPIKSPKTMPAPSLSAVGSGVKQKIVIPANTSQNVILKVPALQKSQVHEINVPGKGVQYIRVVSNATAAKPATKPLVAVPSKTFMFDNKGNLIPMTTEKLLSQPPSLILSTNPASAPKPGQKLMRIAPVIPKTSQSLTASRSSQSLLAPLSPVTDAAEDESQGDISEEEVDSKTALQALIENTVNEGSVSEELECKIEQSTASETSMDGGEIQESSFRSEDHSLIVIPSNFDNSSVSDAHNKTDDSQGGSLLNLENDTLNIYPSSSTPAPVQPAVHTSDFGLRPRKACNCTKSQCLKLYCDCFANGEFCNRCNCNNCHNNLENEELRQKAIRGCLERNPNAFRPKIGKAKIGGPDIRRHNKGCNCKRSGCLKNYCECYEAKIACSSICKCFGCRNVEDALERTMRRNARDSQIAVFRPPPLAANKQPCSFMTSEVIEAVCQCLVAAATERAHPHGHDERAHPHVHDEHAHPHVHDEGAHPHVHDEHDLDSIRDVIEEFARCLQDIISAAHQSAPMPVLDEEPA